MKNRYWTDEDVYAYIRKGGLDSGCFWCKDLKEKILENGPSEIKNFDGHKCATIEYLEKRYRNFNYMI